MPEPQAFPLVELGILKRGQPLDLIDDLGLQALFAEVEAAMAEEVPRDVRDAPRIETDPGRAARWGADRVARGVMGRLKR